MGSAFATAELLVGLVHWEADAYLLQGKRSGHTTSAEKSPPGAVLVLRLRALQGSVSFEQWWCLKGAWYL